MHVHAKGVPAVGGALKWSLAVTLVFVAVEFAAGSYARSLALISDAVHNLSDVPAMALALLAVWLERKPVDRKRTYGYHRAGILAAFVNALALIAVAGYLIWEAYSRLRAPEPVQTNVMLVVAALALVVNSGIALALVHGRRDLNIRAVLVHNAGDAVSNLGILVGAFLIARTGWYAIDPLISFGIAALVLWSAGGILRETSNILLEGLPKGLKLEDVVATLVAIPGVEEIHDVHIWSLGSNLHALSCHVRVADMQMREAGKLLAHINQVLAQRFQITHTTVQFEHAAVQPADYISVGMKPQNPKS
ncbi:MAG: cation diffusion facilitator family transporter [Terriglobia bacterium]